MKNKKIKKVLLGEYQDCKTYVERMLQNKNYQGACFWQTREGLIEELYVELFDKHIEDVIKEESE